MPLPATIVCSWFPISLNETKWTLDQSQLTRINGAIRAIEDKTCIKFELIDNAKMGSYYKNKSHVEIKNVIGGGYV